MIRLALRHRFIVTALLVAAAAATVAVLTALLLPDGQSVPSPQVEAQVVKAPDGFDLDVLQQADDRVSFPPELSAFGPSVGGLAVDAKGYVWIPVFTGGDNGHVLYRYDPGDGKTDSFPLPDNPW